MEESDRDNVVLSDDSIPDGLTPAAKASRARFLERVNANIEATKQISLDILVWGSSTAKDTAVSLKRVEIRDHLNQCGFNAMFSEEIRVFFKKHDHLSEKSIEFEQAKSAHLIITLIEDAPGALAETHDFCNHPDLAPRIFVLIPRKYKAGYSASGAIHDLQHGYGGVYWYKESELSSCNVLKQATKRAEARRQIQARMKTGE